MTTVVLSPFDVIGFPDGGGHFWVYMQYAQGLRRLGCDVYWMEQIRHRKNPEREAQALERFLERMEQFGMRERLLLYTLDADDGAAPPTFYGVPRARAEAVLRTADLVVNFHYGIDPRLLACARRTALIDIDPGLTQIWISTGAITVPPHDVYFTIGENVGTPGPEGAVSWVPIRPPICLDLWPYVHDPSCVAFTTVAGWWSGKWIKTIEDGQEECHDNNKRVAFLEHLALPGLTPQPLELALHLADDDGADQRLLEQHGWRVRPARDVACTPQRYQAYIHGSRGEWSCAKPFFVKLQNAWISDRTVCYLASGKPAVVQDTGPSAYLPNGDGLFRFTTPAQAAQAFDTINADYERHCRAARDLAETHFDARRVLTRLLETALR